VNFVKCNSSVVRISKTRIVFSLFLTLLLSIYLVGCSDQVSLPSAGQLFEFENAGPVAPAVDMDRLARAKISTGPYCVVPDDVLELTMPAILGIVTAERPNVREREQITPYVCRVSESGTITLPVVGKIEVAGKSLAEIESAIINAYYPRYAVTLPSVLARVLEYKTAKVSISGAVKEPGLYELRSDKMSLVALLMEAGGIIDEGAALIRITHSGQTLTNNNIEAPRQKIERVIEHQPKQTLLAVPAARYTVSNEIEVQLTFEQPASSNTTGQLAIMEQDGTILLTEHLDITRDIERRALLKRLAQKDSRVSTFIVAQRLCALAELLKPGSGIHNNPSEIAYGNMNSNTKLNMAQTLLAGGFEDENINSNAKLSASDSKQSFTSDETLHEQFVETYKEILETLDLKRRQEVRKKIHSGKLKKTEPFVLPVKGYNIPFADVALQDGDSVVVERLELPLVTVIGLVNEAGNFPYPPNVQYNLMQALGFAGGLDLTTEPRYATVYRLKPNGGIISAVFKIVDDSKLTEDVSTLIKPGDIVDVAHTPRTRTKLFLDKVFRINLGSYLRLEDAWN